MKKTEKKSNNKNAEVKKTKNKIDSKKINNKERAKYDDMRQIDWYPIDPYCDWLVCSFTKCDIYENGRRNYNGTN